MGEEFEDKVLEAADYINKGDPLKDVLDESDIIEIVLWAADMIKSYQE